MNIRPLKTKVALKEFVGQESTSASGLILVGATESQPEFGVVAIGPEVTDVKLNDRVMIEQGRGQIAGDMIIIDQQFITMVIE
jgi:co-chaperonin GroES (HSP10)